MSQFCRKCGTQMDNEDVFCPRCGAKVKPIATPDAPAQETTVMTPPPAVVIQELKVTPMPVKEKKVIKINWKKIFRKALAVITNPWLVAAVLAVVILISGFSLLEKYKVSYEEDLWQYLDVTLGGDTDHTEDVAPSKMWQKYKDMSALTKVQWLEIAEANCQIWSDHYASIMGGRPKYSYTVDNEEAISTRKLKALGEMLEDRYDINSDHVKAAYMLDVAITIDGKKDPITRNEDMLAVQIGEHWYFMRLLDMETMEAVFLIEEYMIQ